MNRNTPVSVITEDGQTIRHATATEASVNRSGSLRVYKRIREIARYELGEWLEYTVQAPGTNERIEREREQRLDGAT